MKRKAKIRWGLLSTARINRSLIPVIRASKIGELTAVASRSLETAQAYATEWKIPLAFGSYQEMLESGQIDAVYISLPNHLHAEWTVRALEAGVHVLCEKPFAMSLEEVDDMIAASQKSGCILAEAFMYRHHPQTRLAYEIVKSGRLGEISLVWGLFNFQIKNRQDVRLIPEYGGGSLWDVGVYPLSFAQYIYDGPPSSVFGMQWIGDTGVDETFTGQMRYTGDRLALISSSFRTEFQIFFEVIGTQGRLTLNRPFTDMKNNRRMVFTPNKGQPEVIKVPHQELYLGEVEDMHAAILDKAPTLIDLQQTRDHVRTVLALYESARSGKLVNM